MTISSSLSAGVAGLQTNATRLATISDNIANSSTYGYKRVGTDFSSMVLSGGGGSYSAGGVRAQTERLIDRQGSFVSTDNATDLAIAGRGFLPVSQATDVLSGGDNQMFFTTTGSFRTDADGYLRTQSDLILLGWPANADGTFDSFPRDSDVALEPVQININELSGEPTTSITLGINLPAGSTKAGAPGTDETISIEYFGSLGNSESVNVTFTPTVAATGYSNTWRMTMTDTASGGAVIGEYDLTFDNTRGVGGNLLSVATVSGGAYNPADGTVTVNVFDGPIEIDIGQVGDNDGLTQLDADFAPIAISKDGSPVGNVTNVEVDGTGILRAFYNTGEIRTLYKIPLADMSNPNGLIAMDDQTYQVSSNSGDFYLWDAGAGPTGSIVGFAREESSVDVAGELTAMIQTQRAYSSNAKVIQTVDEMLQETTNIKR